MWRCCLRLLDLLLPLGWLTAKPESWVAPATAMLVAKLVEVPWGCWAAPGSSPCVLSGALVQSPT